MSTVAKIVAEYLATFPNEVELQRPVADLVCRFVGADVIDRKNFAGHLTASALVVNRERAEVVLIKHKALDRWLQPGGHVEPGDASPLAAAIRELKEEVGIDGSRLRVIAPRGDELVPMDIDSHPIPANPRKDEPAHMHHDFRYLFVVDGAELATDFGEVDDCRWVAISAPPPREAFPRLLEKAREALGV